MELRHAAIDEIIKCVQSKDNEITISTIYRILAICSNSIFMVTSIRYVPLVN